MVVRSCVLLSYQGSVISPFITCSTSYCKCLARFQSSEIVDSDFFQVNVCLSEGTDPEAFSFTIFYDQEVSFLKILTLYVKKYIT